MDILKIKKLIELFEKKDISELEVEESGFRVKIKKNTETLYASAPAPVHAVNISAQCNGENSESKVAATSAKNDNLHIVKSPIVGTFYMASSPTSDPFIKEGDMVVKGQVLCIIEAMKVMNEIESDVKGKIVSILVENGHPVEYGEPLYSIEMV